VSTCHRAMPMKRACVNCFLQTEITSCPCRRSEIAGLQHNRQAGASRARNTSLTPAAAMRLSKLLHVGRPCRCAVAFRGSFTRLRAIRIPRSEHRGCGVEPIRCCGPRHPADARGCPRSHRPARRRVPTNPVREAVAHKLVAYTALRGIAGLGPAHAMGASPGSCRATKRLHPARASAREAHPETPGGRVMSLRKSPEPFSLRQAASTGTHLMTPGSASGSSMAGRSVGQRAADSCTPLQHLHRGDVLLRRSGAFKQLAMVRPRPLPGRGGRAPAPFHTQAMPRRLHQRAPDRTRA